MYISAETRKAYSEISAFLKCLEDYEINKLPTKLRDFFEREKDINYIKLINPNVPINEQGLKEETLAIIAMLNLKYWCEDETEKSRLRKIYSENEKKYKEEMKNKYASTEIFTSKVLITEPTPINTNQIIKYSQKTFFDKIKELYKKLISLRK